MNRNEMNTDESKRTISRLIQSYETLLDKENEARQNGDERHLRACLDAQQEVLKKINWLMPVVC